MSSSDLQNPLYVHVYNANAITFVEPNIPVDVGVPIGVIVGVPIGVIVGVPTLIVIVLCLVYHSTKKG